MKTGKKHFIFTGCPGRRENFFEHRAWRLLRRRSRRTATRGQIAIIEDGDGVVSRLNAFNLNGKSIAFLPSAITALRYRFQVGQGSYSPERAAAGNPLDGLGDDDSRAVDLPFAFPFFGTSYRRLYVNSDGNLSMGKADNPSEDRSLGRLIAGPPRIAPLFADLDPSQPNASVRVLAEPSRVVLSWVDVPIYQDFGVGLRQSFQIAAVSRWKN